MAKRIRKRDLIIEFLQLITGIGLKKGKKAAPRFELGIKDLQSSALPLGHAAEREDALPTSDRISHASQRLLVICNGHGEDLIALRVLEQLHQLCPKIRFEVLPLVGEGKIFERAVAEGWLVRLGPTIRLPSGGFSNQSLRGLIKDICAGVISTTFSQLGCVRNALAKDQVILAVGDLLPLFMAWLSGVPYGFIGTPKSDYTWRTTFGLAISDYYHRCKGSEWDPWEWIFMRSSRCQMVAVRDLLTARGLRRKEVRAIAPGNPMMDCFENHSIPDLIKDHRRLILLCGSRMPEAKENFQRLLLAVEKLDLLEPLVILAALGAEPSCTQLEDFLRRRGFSMQDSAPQLFGANAFWIKGAQLLFLGVGQFSLWAPWAELGLANAGTATEQLVGLGIPALSLPGSGPQFNNAFAIRQSRLLGGAVMPCSSEKEFLERLKVLLSDEGLRHRLGEIGMRRMGSDGGSAVLASLVKNVVLGDPMFSKKNSKFIQDLSI